MQFLSSRSINFGITINGQRMIVMFSEPTVNGICSYITQRDDIAEAIRRHPHYKNNIVWEEKQMVENGDVETSANKSGKDADRTVGNTAGQGAEIGKENGAGQGAEIGKENGAGQGAEIGNEGQGAEIGTGGQQEDEEKEHEFANFTEAKEWFCKTYGVLKSTVKNPTALQRAAQEKGVVIRIE